MIEFLKSWVMNIITLVMVIVLLEILVPSGKIKKFVDLVSGFILIIAIINPVLSAINKGVDLEEIQISSSNFLDKRAIETNSKILKDKQMKQIAQSYRSKLIQQIEESTAQIKGIGEVKADLIINEDYTSESFGEIKRVYISFRPAEENSSVKPVAKIESVKIGAGQSNQNTETAQSPKVSAELRKQIEDKIMHIMEVPKDNIVISLQNS